MEHNGYWFRILLLQYMEQSSVSENIESVKRDDVEVRIVRDKCIGAATCVVYAEKTFDFCIGMRRCSSCNAFILLFVRQEFVQEIDVSIYFVFCITWFGIHDHRNWVT